VRRATLADVAEVNRWAGADFSEFLANPLNVCLVEGNGGAIFAWRGPGVFEVHVFFEQRGKDVLELSHRMLAQLRERFGARMFWSAIPVASRHVRMFARWMGWTSHGMAMFPHGECEIFSQGEVPCPQQ
jgi:hypothetical protein